MCNKMCFVTLKIVDRAFFELVYICSIFEGQFNPLNLEITVSFSLFNPSLLNFFDVFITIKREHWEENG